VLVKNDWPLEIGPDPQQCSRSSFLGLSKGQREVAQALFNAIQVNSARWIAAR